MNPLSILFIAIGLAMDAFAVSISSGITINRLKLRHAILIASFFGTFQAIMPILGWLGGSSIASYIENFDHWVAFSLLFFIGSKMIYEAYKIEEIEEDKNPLNVYILFIMSIATSIDALAVGLSFAVLKVTVIYPAIVIGIVTFLMSLIGVYIGKKFGHLFEKKVEIIGGLILIFIGIKILLQHLYNF